MKVLSLKDYMHEKVELYKDIGNTSLELVFHGYLNDCPSNVLSMSVFNITFNSYGKCFSILVY